MSLSLSHLKLEAKGAETPSLKHAIGLHCLRRPAGGVIQHLAGVQNPLGK